MDKYNRIQLAVLAIGVLLIAIGGYFSYTAQTVDARKQYTLIIVLGSMVSFSAFLLGLFFMRLRDEKATKEVDKLLRDLKLMNLNDPAQMALAAAVGLSGLVMAENEIVKSVCAISFCLCTYLAVKSLNKSK